jgi:DNA polymerase-3 subunit delta
MILYYYGDNDFGIAQGVRELRQKYVDKVGDELEYERIDVGAAGIHSLLDLVATVPMFATSRLVVVDNLSAAKPEDDQLKALIASADATTVIVVIDPNPDKRSRVYKQLSKLKGAKSYAKLSRAQLVKWLQATAQQQGVELDSAAASYLIDWAGDDQWKLYNELLKIAGHPAGIDKKSIEQLVSPSVEASGFKMLDALFASDLGKLLAEYDRMLADSQSDQQTIGLLNWQLRVLALAREGIDSSSSDWIKANRIAPFVAQKTQTYAQKLTMQQIETAYDILFQVDYDIKAKGLPAEPIMRQVLVELHSCIHQNPA